MNPPSKYNCHQADGSRRRRSATRNLQDNGDIRGSPSAMVIRNSPDTAPFARPSPFRPLSECTLQERMIRLKAVTQAAIAIVNLPLRYDEDTPDGSSPY